MAGTGSQPGADGATPDIVMTDDVLGGDPRIEGHRIGVYHVYTRYVDRDEPPESIASSYEISVADVHAALAYAFSHPDEMRTIAERRRAAAEADAEHRLGPDDVS